MEDGLVSPADKGTPQGGPLSPLLSNLVLDDLDRELERRGHRFCRYADDCNIYVRSRRAGERVMAGVCKFLTKKLRLKVNESKSAVARPNERKLLGFRLTTGAEPQRLISPQVLQRFQARVRELTSRTRGISIERMVGLLKPYLLGWRSYFGFSQDPLVFRNLDARIRRRLRMVIWRQWGKGPTRYVNLRRLGVPHMRAAVAAGSPDWLVGDVATCGRPVSAVQRLFRLARPASCVGRFERLTRPNRRGTNPYARWCDRESP